MKPDAPRHDPQSATQRSRARNARAARILGGIALDADHDRMLRAILARTGETAAAWIRRAIREAVRR